MVKCRAGRPTKENHRYRCASAAGIGCVRYGHAASCWRSEEESKIRSDQFGRRGCWVVSLVGKFEGRCVNSELFLIDHMKILGDARQLITSDVYTGPMDAVMPGPVRSARDNSGTRQLPAAPATSTSSPATVQNLCLTSSPDLPCDNQFLALIFILCFYLFNFLFLSLPHFTSQDAICLVRLEVMAEASPR